MTAPTELDERALEAAVRECARITAPEISDDKFEDHRSKRTAVFKNTSEEISRIIRAYLSALPASEAGWRPLTCKDDRMTCPMPADETAVEVMLQDGTVCPAWYSCNIMEAGDWDFLPVDTAGEPDDDADSIAATVVAWRPADPDRRATA